MLYYNLQFGGFKMFEGYGVLYFIIVVFATLTAIYQLRRNRRQIREREENKRSAAQAPSGCRPAPLRKYSS